MTSRWFRRTCTFSSAATASRCAHDTSGTSWSCSWLDCYFLQTWVLLKKNWIKWTFAINRHTPFWLSLPPHTHEWLCSAPVLHKAFTFSACRTPLCKLLVGDPVHLRVWRTGRPPEIGAVIFSLHTTSHPWALGLWAAIMWGRQVPRTWAMWCSLRLCAVHTHLSWCLRGSTGRTLLKYP